MPTCSQPQCPFATTRVCLEGYKEGCPHLRADTGAQTEVLEEPTVTSLPKVAQEPYRFHSGEKLTTAEATKMMSAVPVTMVLCAGPQRAGKTTFLARIGEMFRKGSFREFQFAGSKTLCAFERVTWLATITAGTGQPDTTRTYRAEKDTFFHLRIQPDGRTDKDIDLLVTDLPGELFPAVLSTKEVCNEQLALARADHLIFFVDCGSIVDSAKRHSERDMACRFLSQIKKCRHNSVTLHVTVVFSRWDKVTLSENQHEVEEYCSIVETDIRERFASSFGGLRFDRIAARPNPGTYQTDAEIQAIFGSWIASGPVFVKPTISRNLKPARDFCAFGL